MLKRTKKSRLHKRLNAWPKLLATQAIACLLACTTVAPAHAQDLGLTEDEKTFIEEHPVIRVGGEVDWGPFDFVDEQGNYSGVANDYLNVISERTGLQFQVETHSFNELLNKLRAGDVDLLPAVFYSEERSKFSNFTTKYHQLAQYIFARDDAGMLGVKKEIICVPILLRLMQKGVYSSYTHVKQFVTCKNISH